MRKLKELFNPPAPVYAAVVANQLNESKLILLDAYREEERAVANRKAMESQVARLTAESSKASEGK